MTYTIGEVATLVDVPASTLRYYDKKGLLPFVEKNKGGIRIFKDTDLEWLRLIECLKATGMSLKDIRRFFEWFMAGDDTLAQRRDMFYERKEAVLQQMAELQETLNLITYKCWFYDTAAQAGSHDAAGKLSPDEIPEDIRELKKALGYDK